MNLRNRIHEKILKNDEKIQDWFKSQAQSEEYPFYSSFDIRESDFKIAPVDANLFPAGFNNICQDDRSVMSDLLKRALDFRKLNIQTAGIFCEEHTNNPYYWDNVYTLKELFEESGVKTFILTPNPLMSKEGEIVNTLVTASGKEIEISSVNVEDNDAFVGEEKIDFILSNNDFSTAYDSWLSKVDTSSLPPLKMGWHKRRKYTFFKIYNELVAEFAQVAGIDKEILTVDTQAFDEFALDSEDSLKALVDKAESFKAELISSYESKGIKDEPYFFVKNSYGTYGLGVIEVRQPEDILKWNYKSRKKMKATKGGKGVSSVILQEGIPTSLKVNESPAEAVIYLLGCSLAGGFLRTNERKGKLDSLNSPGAVFKKLCFSDFEFDKEGKVFENVYGHIARIGALAIGREMEQAN